jgi:hypothetical protein
MEKTKSKNAAPGSNAPVQYRENPRTNEKIDAWIKANPDQFKFFDELPHERAVRKLVLNEVQKYERMQKMNSGIMQKLDNDPEAKQAFETLLKRLPEDQRERATASIARHVFRLTNPRDENGKTPSAGAGSAWRHKNLRGSKTCGFCYGWRSGSPFQRRTTRPAYKSRKTLPFRFEATKGFRCRRLK